MSRENQNKSIEEENVEVLETLEPSTEVSDQTNHKNSDNNKTEQQEAEQSDGDLPEPAGEAVIQAAEQNDEEPAAAEPTEEVAAPAQPVREEVEKSRTTARRRNRNREFRELREAHDKLLAEHEALKDRYLRLAAEMDNFRKRTEREFSNRIQNAFANILLQLLPGMDDLERPLTSESEVKDYEALLNGLKLIHQKFLKILDDNGVKVMQTVGQEFDPNLHDALTQMPAEGTPPGTILQEHAKGYMFHDRVLRPAKVIVSK